MSVKDFRVASEPAAGELPRRGWRFGSKRVDALLLIADIIGVGVVLGAYDLQAWLALEVLVFVAVLGVGGLYRSPLNASALDVLPRLIGFCVVGTLVAVATFDSDITVLRTGLEALSVAATLFAVRIVMYALIRRRRRRNPAARSRTAIIGGGMVASKLLENFAEHPGLGLEPVIVIDSNPLPQIIDQGIPVSEELANLRDIVVANKIDTVIVAFSTVTDQSYVTPLRQCDDLDCEVFVVPRLFEFIHLTSEMERIHTIPLIHVRRNAQRTWRWNAKRAIDFTIALIALICISPILGATALAVRLTDSSAPIIFKQQRIGRQGTLFNLYKFRSMRPVASSASDTDWNPDSAQRLTPIGGFIRKTSLDEIPQLWNVLRGDMSLVGPRPERPHFVEQFQSAIPSYEHRHRVNVGLTGWAAINGLRGDTSIDDRAIYDNFYIENWSIWLDVKIIILTFRALIKGTGS